MRVSEKVIDVEGADIVVRTVDVSSDSTTFATGTSKAVSTWSMTSRKRLVGPLKHGSYVTAVRFAPSGERIATASSGRLIRVFDSRNGDELVTIETNITSRWPSTPLAWSNDGQRIFAVSKDNKIKVFDRSTGSQLAESQTLNGGDDVKSIALATNGKFIATFAGSTISFLAMSTLSQVGPVINDSNEIWAIAMSQNSGYLATGLRDGKITIRDLSGILPDVYGPFQPSNLEERQPDVQPATSGGRDNKPSDSSLKEPGKTGPLRPTTHGEDGNEDLLEVEVSSSAPVAEFDFDEPSSPGSSVHCEDEVPPVGTSQATPHLPDALPMASPPLARAEEHLETVESSQGITKLKKWVQRRTKKGKKEPTLHKPGRAPRKSRRPAGGRSPPQSPARIDATNEGPSWIAAGQRVPRMVATSPDPPKVASSSSLYARIRQALQPKPPIEDANASHANEDTSRPEQGSANPEEWLIPY
ncbi:quinon protein alcohol dehydrogenase-like superfamily [Butyriboletus roseoflavus]|nr:quinon protein alcohol dehydrogenase-like superfamily [Butyriboletus roseoflavus]